MFTVQTKPLETPLRLFNTPTELDRLHPKQIKDNWATSAFQARAFLLCGSMSTALAAATRRYPVAVDRPADRDAAPPDRSFVLRKIRTSPA